LVKAGGQVYEFRVQIADCGFRVSRLVTWAAAIKSEPEDFEDVAEVRFGDSAGFVGECEGVGIGGDANGGHFKRFLFEVLRGSLKFRMVLMFEPRGLGCIESAPTDVGGYTGFDLG
jgi:hypothetical protein